jgi:poly-gamma-glutamate synthesis protein (capsule biosynthesis protein)
MSYKDRINLYRRRQDIRKYLSIKNGIILTSVISLCILSTIFIGNELLKNKVKNSTIVYKAQSLKIDNVDANTNTDVNANVEENKKENTENIENKENSEDKNNEQINSLTNIENTDENQEKKADDGSVNLCLLGEIMLGGEVTKNLNYNYLDAFKKIYTLPKAADFTYANFSTNITNLEKIENAKSKYLVTKDAISAMSSIGLDAVSIASDHITDYEEDIFKNTVSLLEKNEMFVAGRENTPLYFEKGNQKIAIISTNAVINGTARNYTKQGISVYELENLEKNIKEAKLSANIVIVDVHWGKEYTYGVNAQMKTIATSAIDLGADMVIGSHALGVYPIVKYKDKPIIYSTGFFISDTDYNVGKEGFIFDLKISNTSKIESITMTPIYTKDKSKTMLYNEYNGIKAKAYIELFNKWHVENSLDSRVIDDKIVVTL